MPISSKYIVVEKYVPPKTEGFETAQAIGDEVYKGVVVRLPEITVFIGNQELKLNDVIIFAPHSPDTFLIQDRRYVRSEDILEIL